MKKIIYILFAFLSVWMNASAREITGTEAQRLITGAQQIRVTENSSVPEYIKFRAGSEISFNLFEKWAHSHFTLPSSSGFKLLNKSTDKLGYTHYRYQQTINGIPVEGTMYLVHAKNNLVTSMNGLLFDKINATANASISKTAALNNAIRNMNAKTYRWQIAGWEQQIKQVNNDPSATWYPKGELVYAPQNGKYTSENYRLCYKFDVYAQEPLDRQYVFVDAVSGAVIYKLNRIHDADATGTAVTAYSGTRTITTDSVGPNSFRLRETARGLGIETYNLQQGTNYNNTDFTDTDNFWDNVNAQQDEYATDAHWGAEMTYDFYMLKFNRNSIDDNGQKLLSYVHYDVNYTNAFWDGTAMTYGDGGGVYTPLTSLDVTGHEISHGVTELTCGLIYADEPGAMNEGFSDCMGNAIRYFGKQPATIDWFIGDEIGGTPFRNMADPNQFQNPDCYDGLYWNAPNEVHNNSGVLNFWFYLLTEGGSGTNDLGDAYTVSSIGIDNAAAILYRTWATYLFPNAEYADARYYSIQAAIDLFGPCTPEAIATVNAWHAVGVGLAFIPGVTSDFNATTTSYCQVPATVNFTNASNNAGSFVWDFGDGSPTSTAVNPVHTYTSYGLYDVTLVADGGTCGTDSITKNGFISVDSLNPCIVILPPNGTATTQTSCAGQLYDSGGPNADYTDMTDALITIAPLGASTVTLTFTMFDMENTYDFLYIYDGPTTASPLIGAYTGTALPNGGIITSTAGSITLRQTSDPFITGAGFALTWQCLISTLPPTVNFTADVTTSCSGVINFTDLSINGPTSWLWDFGDLSTSTLQNPSHTYAANGTYTVTLTASNVNGSNALTKTAYITINQPQAPTANGVTICAGLSASLTATGVDSLTWFTVPAGGTAVYTGTTFNTPPLSINTTYYVESDVYPALQSVGPVDNTFSAGSIFNNNNYHDLIFDCFVPVKLISVKVYADGAGNRTITLNDAGGNTLQQATVNIPDGMSIVPLNFNIPVGTNLELGCEGNVNLFRNQGGAIFPYTLSGVISITGTNAGAPGYYYYFYDWQLQGPPCVSPRTPVTVTVDPAPTAAFSTSNVLSTYTFTDNSTGATSWFWDFGDGTNTTGQGPVVHTYTANGTYVVMLIVSNGNCQDTAYFTIVVTTVGIEQLQNESLLTVYPNPAVGAFTVNWNQPEREQISISLTDQLGRTVFGSTAQIMNPGSHSMKISTTGFADGIYFLQLKGENSSAVKKITVMN
ncbi:MAG TPA: PKD domain-containing protein [Bacteroidia bacterium]|nr:PKD domain-containing protein [Bacteroidia bacterium]